MFNSMFFYIFLFCSSYSCGEKNKPCKIYFDQEEIKFPLTAQAFSEAMNLGFAPYVGFLKKDIETGETLILNLEGFGMFPGDDRDRKEKYLNKNVVGLTVWYPQDKFDFIELKDKIEKEYGIKFNDKYYFETPRKDKSTGDYYLVEYSNCITMVYRHRNKNNVFSIFYDLDKKEIEEYVY